MKFLKESLIAVAFLFSTEVFAQEKNQDCFISFEAREAILDQVTKNNPNAIKSLPACFKLDRKLIFKAALIDAAQFENSAQLLKEDENFVGRLLKVNPIILKFASSKLRQDQIFMEHATYLNRDALQYGDSTLLDNKIFMKKMITIDSRNYIFASERLKQNQELAEIALSDDGLLLAEAPKEIRSNLKLIKIALKSNSLAIDFVADELKKDKEIQYLAGKGSSLKSSISKEEMTKFLQENYVIDEKKKNLGLVISNKAKFFGKQKIIARNYVTKWQRSIDYSGPIITADLHLISVDSHNYPIRWKEDFRKYPTLIKKIENFFLKHNIDESTINDLSTTYLWKVKSDPLTFVFNLYLLGDSDDADLGVDFANITSLTAVVQQRNKKWEMTVVEVIFNSEIKVDVAYENGHKRYVLWDLYAVDKKDKNPKIIFEIDDRFKKYFEIFEEQSGGKYKMIYQIEPDLGK